MAQGTAGVGDRRLGRPLATGLLVGDWPPATMGPRWGWSLTSCPWRRCIGAMALIHEPGLSETAAWKQTVHRQASSVLAGASRRPVGSSQRLRSPSGAMITAQQPRKTAMSDFHALGHECLARQDEVESLRHWMNGLDAGDQRCGEAITRFIRDTLCLAGGSWETIAHYLDYDLSESDQRSFHGKKFVGMKEVPLLTVDWPAFSFAGHPQLADLENEPPEAWRCFKNFCRERGITASSLGQYEIGFWPAERTTALLQRLGGPGTTVPVSLFFSAAADGSGLRIGTPLIAGERAGDCVFPSQRWLFEAFFRLGEDESRGYAGKQPFTLGELVGRARAFCLDVESVEDPDMLYRGAEFFPRPAAWSAEANWKVVGSSLRRLVNPVREIWVGYFIPANPDARHLQVCIEGAVHAVTTLVDWYAEAFSETFGLLERQDVAHQLFGSPAALHAILADDEVNRGCWPEQFTPMFAGMDRGDPTACAAWEQVRGTADRESNKNGRLS